LFDRGAAFRLVILSDGQSSLELQEWRHPRVTESPPEHLGYRTTGLKEVDWMVPDLDKLVKDLEEKGFKPRTPIWTFKFQGLIESRQVLYFDPDGVTVQFTALPCSEEDLDYSSSRATFGSNEACTGRTTRKGAFDARLNHVAVSIKDMKRSLLKRAAYSHVRR